VLVGCSHAVGECDPGAQAANVSRAQHRPILTFMTAKRYRPQFLISSIFMLYQQFDGARAGALACFLSTPQPCPISLVGSTRRVLPAGLCLVGRGRRHRTMGTA
jgi:hypothetical protein